MTIEMFDDAERHAIAKAIQSDAFQNLIGAEEWDLSDVEEANLWSAISKLAEPNALDPMSPTH